MKETVLFNQNESVNSAVIYVYDKTGEIMTFKIENDVRMGRSTEGSDVGIPLYSAIASRKHGEFFQIDGKFYYKDTNSSNGTYVNGVRYGKDEETDTVCLKDGDIIRIDHSDLMNPHSEAILIIFSLGGVKEKEIWKKEKLYSGTGNIEIGREITNHEGFRIESDWMSRNHATLIHGMNGWSVCDNNSTNGVFVNNKRIEAPVALSPFDVVRAADVYFIYTGSSFVYNTVENESETLSIKIKERSVKKMFKKKILLQDINLDVNAGEMVLILGGSGAGKSTFMNAVMGYEKAEGEIYHGNVNVYKEYDKVRDSIGFVPQQDLIRYEDSVYDTICNMANMKLPSKMTAQEKNDRIEDVMNRLGLQRERNSLVGKLSGGQKKRLSIALELISNPSLFFLDEPDSGLDGIMASELMQNLRVLADDGKIVMVITHSPDRVAKLFDKLIVLAKSAQTNCGHLAFYGTIPEAKDFFETDSLEGIVKRINRPDEGGDGLSDHYINKFKEYKAKQER